MHNSDMKNSKDVSASQAAVMEDIKKGLTGEAPVGFLIVNAEGRIAVCNEPYKEFLGIDSARELAGIRLVKLLTLLQIDDGQPAEKASRIAEEIIELAMLQEQYFPEFHHHNRNYFYKSRPMKNGGFIAVVQQYDGDTPPVDRF